MSGMNLSGAQFRERLSPRAIRCGQFVMSDLGKADLTGTDMRDAVLQGANLADATLENAKLQERT